MFDKLLIANRGEIACRIARTARVMGLSTVAVYSEADRLAPHVAAADEAVAIGPAPAAESYLSIGGIIEACRASGAGAVHPGYGFLAENADFAEALAGAGIVFVGPPADAIRAMGDKLRSKELAEAAGVATVPGSTGAVADVDEAVAVAEEIGFPVILKASAGGGGKGMRLARSPGELRDGFAGAQSEARAAFGDDRLFVEQFIERSRHIEMQVLADSHGTIVHLGERECSIQRRNQKVIEEAPSPFLDRPTRDRMAAQAVALAHAVNYQSAGTVEFVVAADRRFHFLEMNTRLQVEHPVTELVTGVDLVAEMIRIAQGARLSASLADVAASGWAIEARIYAEDPSRDFLPSIGRVTRYRPPPAGTDADGLTVRVETGVAEGSEIPVHYDPMIAKLCVHARGEGQAARQRAVAGLTDALDAFTLAGVRHNIGFLSAIAASRRFRDGDTTTAFIAEEFPDGFGVAAADDAHRLELAAIAASVELVERDRLDRLAEGHTGCGLPADWAIQLGDAFLEVSISEGGTAHPFDVTLAIAGRPVRVVTAWRPGETVWRGRIGDAAAVAQVIRSGHRVTIARRGVSTTARLLTPAAARLERLMPVKAPPDTSRLLLSPMPGLLVSLAADVGQEVRAGEALATVEAMKMENVLRAERDVTIKAIRRRPGDSLAVDDVIMEFA